MIAAIGPGRTVGFWRRYLALIAVANLIWEALQLPLYTIWQFGTPKALVLAVIHCTSGDVLIAGLAFGLALLIVRLGGSQRPTFATLIMLATGLGLAYTVFSEWLNVEWRASWAYSAAMPRLPPFGTGLSPILQWLLVPPLCLLAARSTSQGATP